MDTDPSRWVVVASDQSLVAEAIGAALTSKGLGVVRVTWAAPPATPGLHLPPGSRAVGLLLGDLDRPARVRETLTVLHAVAVPWLVLVGQPRGPLWGGLLEHGARSVAHDAMRLQDLLDLLETVDGDEHLPEHERRELITAWQDLVAERVDVAARVSTTTVPEREVLGLLHRGLAVPDIADRLAVAEETVRARSQGALGKLGVQSEVAAVAILDGSDLVPDEIIAELAVGRPSGLRPTPLAVVLRTLDSAGV